MILTLPKWANHKLRKQDKKLKFFKMVSKQPFIAHHSRGAYKQQSKLQKKSILIELL